MVTTLAALITAVLLVASCAGDPAIPSNERFNFFDFELLQNVAKSSTGNILVSPVSVKATLAMLLEAAHGATAAEIQTALRIPAKTPVQSFLKAYLETFLERGSGYTLELSNRVFVSDARSLNDRYAAALREFYYADVDSVDFQRPYTAASKINKWVREKTQGLIPELVSAASLNPDAQALVANAVYFKGLWKTPFQPAHTRPLCFYTEANKCITTDMMYEMADYRFGYVDRLDTDVIELPYKGGKFSMVLLLPKSKNGIDQLVHDIDHVHMSDIINSMETVEVMLHIPRFTIDYNVDLVQTLRQLNIREIFSPSSNLTGMFAGTEATATISNVFHKAKIIVNEEGSEAAGGTGALVVPLMGTQIASFRADHPFLFFIRSTINNAILFAGRVSEPDQARQRPTQDQELQSIYPQPPKRGRPTSTEGYSTNRPNYSPTNTNQFQFASKPTGQASSQSQNTNSNQRPVERPVTQTQPQYQNTNSNQRPVERPVTQTQPHYQNTNSNQRPVERPVSQTHYQNTNSPQRPTERPAFTFSPPNQGNTQYQNTNSQQRPTERPVFSQTNPTQTQYQNPSSQQRPERPTSQIAFNEDGNYQTDQMRYPSNVENRQSPPQNMAPISELQYNQQPVLQAIGLSAFPPPQAYNPPQTPYYDTRYPQNNYDSQRRPEVNPKSVTAKAPEYRPQPNQNIEYTPRQPSIQYVVPMPAGPHFYSSPGTSFQGSDRGVPAQTNVDEVSNGRTTYQQQMRPVQGHDADAIVFNQRVLVNQ